MFLNFKGFFQKKYPKSWAEEEFSWFTCFSQKHEDKTLIARTQIRMQDTVASSDQMLRQVNI